MLMSFIFLETSQFFMLFNGAFIVISKLCVGFIYGVMLYFLLNNKGYNLKIINKLSINDLIFIILTVYIILSLILSIIGLLVGFLNEILIFNLETELNLFNSISDSTNTNNSSNNNTNNNSSSSATQHGNSALMGIGLGAGIKMAQTQPTIAGKFASVTGGIVLGSGAIIVKNISQNISTDLGNKILPNIFSSYINAADIFGITITGNHGLDLLTTILRFNSLSIMFLLLIIYNYLLSKINITYIGEIISQYLPTKYVNYIMKILIKIQKSNNIIIIFLFVLLLISLILSYYYLDFFINNIDKIIELYFKK